MIHALIKFSRYAYLLCTFACISFAYPASITYRKTNTRFGDCIINYVKAKWFAHKYNLSLYYQPFPYSHFLTLHYAEPLFDHHTMPAIRNSIALHHEKQLTPPHADDILFVSNFYSQTEDLFAYILKNPSFDADIKHMLAPINPTPFCPPDTTYTVAVHIRKGGGFDKPLRSAQLFSLSYDLIAHEKLVTKPRNSSSYADYCWPEKFPPEQYYIDQINLLSELLDDPPLHLYLFTDEQDIQALATRIQQQLHNKNIMMFFRTADNNHETHVIDDFYTLSLCDFLIRADSAYAIAAQFLGKHMLVISPKKSGWYHDTLIIYEVEIRIVDYYNRVSETFDFDYRAYTKNKDNCIAFFKNHRQTLYKHAS
jgi:hypothetical protein